MGKADALAYALLMLLVFNVWAAVHYWLAGKTMTADLARAQSV